MQQEGWDQEKYWILTRLNNLKNYEPKLHVNIGLVAQNTIKLMINNITTIELVNISAIIFNNFWVDLDYN